MAGEDTAIVQGTVRVTATIVDQQGQFGAKGEKHTIVTTAPIRDTWVKTPDGWRRKIHEKLAANKPIVDGKPFEPPARAADPENSPDRLSSRARLGLTCVALVESIRPGSRVPESRGSRPKES